MANKKRRLTVPGIPGPEVDEPTMPEGFELDSEEGLDLNEQLEEIKPQLANAGLLAEDGGVSIAAIQEAIESVADQPELPVPAVPLAALSDAVTTAVEASVPATPAEVIVPTPEVVKTPMPTPAPLENVKEAQAKETVPDKVRKVMPGEDDLYKKLVGKLSPVELAAFTLGDIKLYDETGKKPDKTLRDNYYHDRRRSSEIRDWTNGELLDWVEGLITAPRDVDESMVFDEICRRQRLPANWTFDQLRTYLKTGTKPDYTQEGVLVQDRQRASKQLHQWSYLELRAGLMDEIESSFTEEELFAALRKRLNLNEDFPRERLRKSFNSEYKESSMDNMMLQARLDEYKAIMTKGATLSDKTAGPAQKMLADAIMAVMNRESTEFYEGWLKILDFVNVNYPIMFTPERARKGWAYISLKGKALTTFEDLLTVIIQTRSPVGRNRNAKLYDLGQILRNVPSERARVNVINFYHTPQ